jgi:AbrB family looped-hinge helix DNA binding protein
MMYEGMTTGAEAMARLKLSAVQAKGQVTIPASIRERLGLKKGDLVAFVETSRGVLITPQEVVATTELDKIGEALKDKGVSLQDLIEGGRDIRGGLIEEGYGLANDEA